MKMHHLSQLNPKWMARLRIEAPEMWEKIMTLEFDRLKAEYEAIIQSIRRREIELGFGPPEVGENANQTP